MSDKYFPPTYKLSSFHCPFCNVNSTQIWHDTYHILKSGYYGPTDILMCICGHCDERAYWFNEKMIIPLSTNAPYSHPDMPLTLINDYNEARNIVNLSPRGAAALLRLVLQKLMTELGESGKDINKDIGSLVQKGLPKEVQQALDIVRVIGNESVHPGELNLNDDQDTALQLFNLINFIIEERIARPKRISAFYEMLPESKRNGIQQRDQSTTPSP